MQQLALGFQSPRKNPTLGVQTPRKAPSADRNCPNQTEIGPLHLSNASFCMVTPERGCAKTGAQGRDIVGQDGNTK